MPTRRDEKWHCRWKCSECREHGRLGHCDMFFAPDICPGCGAEKKYLGRTRMRYEPPKYRYKFGFLPVKVEEGEWKMKDFEEI